MKKRVTDSQLVIMLLSFEFNDVDTAQTCDTCVTSLKID
ncbi:hypothetical protein SPSINT_1788 [Staphylococcus pseudintermedius HKU10-03]|nr:hypothetical protein SPSINT_1788 [Staphylococcus pseudintermedius HKU10-03]